MRKWSAKTGIKLGSRTRDHGRNPAEDRGSCRRRGGRNIETLTRDRIGVFPHFLSAQNVVNSFTSEAGAGGHLFRDWEFVGAGVARPFVEPGLGGDDEEVGTRGAEQRCHPVPGD
jgi:hypothetical protein